MTYSHAIVSPFTSALVRSGMFRRNVRGSNGYLTRSRTNVRRRRRVRVGRGIRTVQPYMISRNLKTVVVFSIDAGAGTIYQQSVKLNSAFDPTGTLGSGQPLGFDQYTALYQRCAVVKWSVKLEICSTDNTNPLVIGFTPLPGS